MFTEWSAEVDVILNVMNIKDWKRMTSIAIMWKLGVVIYEITEDQPHEWGGAKKMIQEEKEKRINEAFAIFKFWKMEKSQ